MSERLCDFALGSNKTISARQKSYFVINKAQCELFDPVREEAHRIQRVEGVLRKHDWSMSDGIVELALTCLRRDYSELERKTQRAMADGLTRSQALTWSIFREVRKIDAFAKNFGIKSLPSLEQSETVEVIDLIPDVRDQSV